MVVNPNKLERELNEHDEKIIQEYEKKVDEELERRYIPGRGAVYIDTPKGARNYEKVFLRIKQMYGEAGWIVGREHTPRNESYLSFEAKKDANNTRS